MNKRHLHHIWKKLKYISPWYLVVLTVISGAIAVFALRSNNHHMIKLRSAVYVADKNDSDVKQSLNNLRHYVYRHMNTSLTNGNDSVYPPIQLKYTYDRLVTAQSAKVADTNQKLYTAAQHHCEKLNSVDFSGHNRVPCIEAYVKAHGGKVQAIPSGLYKFAFVSPTWSPDLAGWSLVATIALALTSLVLFVVRWWFKRYVA